MCFIFSVSFRSMSPGFNSCLQPIYTSSFGCGVLCTLSFASLVMPLTPKAAAYIARGKYGKLLAVIKLVALSHKSGPSLAVIGYHHRGYGSVRYVTAAAGSLTFSVGIAECKAGGIGPMGRKLQLPHQLKRAP